MLLSYHAFVEGRWDEAARWADEGVAWAERLGFRLVAMPGLYCLALLAAGRGDEHALRSRADELVTWAAPRGLRMLEHLAGHARGLAALGRGDYEEAYRQASVISPPGDLAPHVPVALLVTLDLVESAIRTGRRAEAEAHLAAMQHSEVFRLRPRLALMAAGAAAMVASGSEADLLYQEAVAVPGAEEFPFELARVRLAYGEHLRRKRASHAAGLQLAAALSTFRGLGAQPWLTRAQHELSASGLPHPSSTGSGHASALTVLTPQELEIASLAASGLSNKQIGSRLYLSPRTVSGHLYRIFPKLGISTRAALRDALMNAPPPDEGPGG
jgi:DNA-binding NarL/FixJ family response regulator